MIARTWTAGAAMVAAGLLAGCVSGGAEVADPAPTPLSADATTATEPATTEEATSSTASTSTIPVAERLPALGDDVLGAVRSDTGVLLPITDSDGEVWFVLGPCGDVQIEPAGTAMVVGAQHVVLDPGQGDDDAGQVNLAVAERAAALLAADGVVVALTRTGGAEISEATRGAGGPAVGAAVFVSIQRGDNTGRVSEEAPRPTVFHRADDANSRRLAGLLHDELATAFDTLAGPFVAQDEPGVRPLLNQRGEDYFGVLRASEGVAAARAELLTLGENATTLLASEEGREIEARALADAIVRFLVTNEEGNGFIDPVEAVRTAPTSNTPGGC